MILQRTLVLPTPLSISPMQRYHALVLIPRMSSFWHVMLLVYSHQWASWIWHKQCTISSVATLLWYVPCHFFYSNMRSFGNYLNIMHHFMLSLKNRRRYAHLVANDYFCILVIESEFVLDFRWLEQRMVLRSQRQHFRLALVQHLSCCILPSMQQCWLRRCRSMVLQDGSSTLDGQVEGVYWRLLTFMLIY